MKSFLCRCTWQTPPDQRRVLCILKTDYVTACVLAILGAGMLYIGYSLLFGTIGTIPGYMGGVTLMLAAAASLVSVVVITAKRGITESCVREK